MGIMESQVEKKVANEMETLGPFEGVVGMYGV